MHRRYRLLLPGLAVVGLAALGSSAEWQTSPTTQGLPSVTIVPFDVLIPAPTPPDDRELAILQLAIASSEVGVVEAVELQLGRIVSGYSPYVIDGPGPWAVQLVSESGDVRSFGILDPRFVHVYGEDDDVAHRTLLETLITTEVIVPLSDRGRSLNVVKINILDDLGRTVLATLYNPESGTFSQISPFE